MSSDRIYSNIVIINYTRNRYLNKKINIIKLPRISSIRNILRQQSMNLSFINYPDQYRI